MPVIREAEESPQIAGHVPVQSCRGHAFVGRRRPGAAELREQRNIGYHGSVLVVAFVVQEPEQTIPDERPADIKAGLLAVERGRLLADAGGKCIVAP